LENEESKVVINSVQQLQAQRDLSSEDEIRFLNENEFPIQHGSETTFVFRGQADRVELRHWIYGLPSNLPFQRFAGTNLWFLTLQLPEGSRIEYKLEISTGTQQRLIRDPLNRLQAHDPFGSNSVCHGPGYTTPTWTLADPEARSGDLSSIFINSKIFGARRKVTVYLPPRYRSSRAYPLLIVHDGPDFLRYASFKTVLDNLIYRLEISPPVVALIRSSDRLTEYAANREHAIFVAEELLPRLESSYSLLSSPAGRMLMGASFGAVAALSTSWRYPGLFGGLMLESGSFAFTDIGKGERGPAFEPVVEFMNHFRADPGNPVKKVFLSCGMYESLIYENRSLAPVIQSTGMELRYVESRDGHNWENWRDRMREGLSFLLPGPLWLVYE
jgi:enterochelin esterase family protein